MGVDPGTNLMGYGVIKITDNKPQVLVTGSLSLKGLSDVYLKLSTIFKRTTQIIDTYLPDELAIESQFLRDTELKYPHFDATKLNSNNASITTGGEYSGQAGQPDATIDYRERLETNWTKLKGELTPTPENTFEVNRAYGDFKRRVANQVAVGVEPDAASETQYKIVQNLLNQGAYEAKAVEAREGREIEPADIITDSKNFRADTNKVRFNSKFNSLAEQLALVEYKKFKLYGEPFPTYFKGVTRGTNVSATQFAEDRFRSVGGYNELGEVAQRFTVDPESGVLVDKQFGLTQEQLNQFEINPHLIGKEKANDILEQFLGFGFNAYEMKNSYDVDFYLRPQELSLRVVDGPLEKQMDVLFTNKTAEILCRGS